MSRKSFFIFICMWPWMCTVFFWIVSLLTLEQWPDTGQYVITVAIAFVCKVILFWFIKSRYIWKITTCNHYLVYFLYDCWYLLVMVIFHVWVLCEWFFLFLTWRVALNLICTKTLFKMSSVILRSNRVIMNKKIMRHLKPSSDLSFHGWYILLL